MAIELEYVLKRNKSTLATFITKNKLTSYDDLIQYCGKRNFFPCKKEEFEITMSMLNDYSVSKASKSEVKNVHKTIPDKNKVDRKTSKTREPKKRRNSSKKQQSTSKLSNSSDKG